MNMELSNKLFNNSDFIPTLREINTMKLPVKSSYRLNKIVKELESHLQVFSEERQKLFEKHGQLDENQEQYVIPADNVEPFRQEFEQLLEIPFTIDAKKIDLPGDIELSVAQLNAVEDIFEFNFED